MAFILLRNFTKKVITKVSFKLNLSSSKPFIFPYSRRNAANVCPQVHRIKAFSTKRNQGQKHSLHLLLQTHPRSEQAKCSLNEEMSIV